MTPDSPIILVSPGTHYSSYHWPNTAALMRALRQKGLNVRAVTFSTSAGPMTPDLKGSVEAVFSRLPPGWRHVAEEQWQQRRFGT